MTVSRRRLMQAGLAAGVATLGPWSIRAALADAETDRRTVLVVLRGAMDGLAAVPPHGDPAYAGLRGSLALPGPGQAGGMIDLDGFYGLNPALAPIAGWYKQGQLLAVHAVATPYRDRSHFDAQDLLENGTATPHGVNDGWLNRALGTLGGRGRRLGLAVGQGVPLVLRGTTPVASWSPSPLPAADPGFLALVAGLYRGDPDLSAALGGGEHATAIAAAAQGNMMGGMASGGKTGPAAARHGIAQLASTAGRMLAEPDGPRVAVVDLYGWDTHVAQGTTQGRLVQALDGLATALTSLRDGLGDHWRTTAVMCATEFGRTARPNGSNGTDHGTAGVALLTGGAVAGGRVLARWPGLAEGRLYQDRDLAPTTDMRSVFKGVLRAQLGLSDGVLERTVFPGSHDAPPLDGLVAAV